MSLHLIEMKIKTALELATYIADLNDGSANCGISKQDWTRQQISKNLVSLRGVLREIINRPKEEGNDE